MTLIEFDNEIRTRFPVICGVDEAGRGPLAGDVYAAAVVFDKDVIIDGVNDSKKLSEKKREILFDEITSKAVSYSIATASVEEIESMNILNAAMLAMKRAVEGLSVLPDIALIDGNKTPDAPCKTFAVVKGDSASFSIAAASILAKVARDRYMAELDRLYPQYQFAKHKGYGTKLHYEMIKKYGISPVHRKSFLKRWFKENDVKRNRKYRRGLYLQVSREKRLHNTLQKLYDQRRRDRYSRQEGQLNSLCRSKISKERPS